MFHGRCRLARFAILARYGMVWYGMCVAVYSFVSPAYLAHPIPLTHSLEKSLEYVVLIKIGRQRKRKQLFSRYVRTHARTQTTSFSSSVPFLITSSCFSII